MFDVLILGGGLAGLNAAQILLTKKGIRVGLIEKGLPVKNNPIRLTYVDTLTKFGLKNCIKAEYNQFGLISYHGARSVHSYKKNMFAALDYQKACSKIYNQVIKNDTFKMIQGRAVSLNKTNSFVEIKLKDGHKYRTKLFIDASGIAHFANKQLNNNLPQLYSHSYGQSFSGTKNEKKKEAWFISGSIPYGSGGGWYYPFGENKASVGFALITKDKRFPAKELREKYRRAITEISPIKQYLKNAHPEGYEIGTIPIEHLSSFNDERILVIGDAAGQATPWMCMGVEPALENSAIAADIAIKALEENNFSHSFLLKYQQKWNENNAKNYNSFNKMEPKLWFLGEAVWDFIIEKDIGKLSANEFLERIRYNKHIMPKHIALVRWAFFRLQHLLDWGKYK